MGNIFHEDRLSEVKAGNQQQKRTSQSKAKNHELSPEEIARLKKYYEGLCDVQSKPDGTFINVVNENALSIILNYSYNFVHPFLRTALTNYFNEHHILLFYDVFEKFVIEATRSRSIDTLKILWTIAENDKAFPNPSLWSSQLQRFCGYLLFFSSGFEDEELEEEKLYEISLELIEFYEQFLNRSHPNHIIGSDLPLFFNTIQSITPHAAKSFETVIATIFLDLVKESPSYKPYKPIYLTTSTAPTNMTPDASIILTHYHKGFLGMLGDHLQGQWQRLYTSQCDGISFNRLEHHLLGYDGPTVLFIRIRPRPPPRSSTYTSSSSSSTARKIREEKINIIGVYCHERWKESNKFYGKLVSC
jgi:hypothetical protein